PPGAALVVDAPPGTGHRPGHLRGAQGPQSGDPDLLRGHGTRGPRGRAAPRLPSASCLAHGVPAGAPLPRGAGRRLRVGRVVLRLQASSQARPGPSPPPDGRRPPTALASPEGEASTRPWPGSFSSAGKARGFERDIRGSTVARLPIQLPS